MSIQAEIHLDDKCYKVKPSRYAGAISNRITAQKKLITPKELATALCNGQTAVCGIMNGNRTVQNFINQKVVMLDFDNEKDKKRCTGSDYITLAEVKSHPYIRENASFVYKTFSNTEAHEKFRVVFILDKTLTKVSHVYNVYNRLFKEFPQADISCKDPSRIFFGGTGYEEINFNNTLEVLASDLAETIKETKQILPKVVKSPTASDNSPKKTITTYNEVAEAIANADLIELDRLIGDRYAMRVPSINLAMRYFKNINMCELFDLPLDENFHDLFHDETTPSARIYHNETGYYYKCFSSSAEFGGDLLAVISKLTGKGRVDSLKYALKIFKVEIQRTEEEQKVITMIEVLVSDINSPDFKQVLPNVYSVINRERMNVVAILNLIKENTFYDTESDSLRTAIVMSSSTIAKAIGTSEKTVKRTMSKMKAIGMITAVPNNEIPKDFLKLLEAQRIKEVRKYRTSMHEVKHSDNYTENLETQSLVFNSKGVVLNSLNKQGLTSAMGLEVAKKVYVQDNVTGKLSTKVRNFLKRMVANASTLLDEKNYVKESDLISLMINNRTRKSYATENVQKFRGYLIDSLKLKRVKVTKATKEEYPQLSDLPYNSFVYVKEDK